MLGRKLSQFANQSDVIVIALPRGGVPVGYEVAKALNTPLDIFVVRKLGVPWHEELAMGAIASGGVRLLNESVVDSLGIDAAIIEQVVEREQQELERREREYRGDRPAVNVKGLTVIIVDDGIATGSTMYAAVSALSQHGAGRIIVATPTIASATYHEMRSVVDGLVAVIVSEEFHGVGQWYFDFSQTTDGEVRELLSRASKLQKSTHL